MALITASFPAGAATGSAQPEPAFDPEKVVLPRFGVALFDESRSSGWACLPGKNDEPFRFRTPEDLKNDCVWICSAEGMDFTQSWGRMHHMRPANYISKLTHIAADIGVRTEGQGRFGASAQRASKDLASLIHRSVVYAAQAYQWQEPMARLRQSVFADDLRVWLNDTCPPPPMRSDMRAAVESAHQSYSAPVYGYSTFEPGNLTVTIRPNRLDYARRIMATPMPDGNWNYIDSSSAGGLREEDLKDPERPSLMMATVEFSGHDVEKAALCAYGAQISSKSRTLRTWLTQTEMAWLGQYAEIRVGAAFISEHRRLLPEKLLLPDAMLDPLCSPSISVGMVAEAHWKALVTEVYKPALRKREVSMWGLWLRAADRAMSFDLARRVQDAGFTVLSYGNGQVVLNCKRDKLYDLMAFCMQNDVAHPNFRGILMENGLLETTT